MRPFDDNYILLSYSTGEKWWRGKAMGDQKRGLVLRIGQRAFGAAWKDPESWRVKRQGV